MRAPKTFAYIQFFRCIPADILYFISRNRNIINCDLARVLDEIPYDKVGIGALNYSLLFIKNFRNVYYFRTENSKILRIISRMLLPQLDALEIHGKIDAGLRIYHNYGVIHPYSAGKNFTVHHGVTIGKGRTSDIGKAIVDPIFGDDVEVMSNAIVYGGITIGNNVTIGAGSLVNKNVPDNCVVVGTPMRIISKNR